jgi:hypothetical protein
MAMKEAVLLELVAKWERDAKGGEAEDGAPEAQRGNHIRMGERQAKRECADHLRMLIRLLGGNRIGEE